MSPLAGPVAAAAVIFARGTRIPDVDDSKRLDGRATRAAGADHPRARAVAWAVAYAEVDEIDCINIYWAGLAAMRRAIEALSPAAEHLLIDGRRLRDVPLPQQRIIKGDTKSLSIAAASILAKTARDARMRALDAVYPGYGFAQHKGYPVPAHFRALRRLGRLPDPPAIVRASCARCWGCRRCRRGRCGQARKAVWTARCEDGEQDRCGHDRGRRDRVRPRRRRVARGLTRGHTPSRRLTRPHSTTDVAQAPPNLRGWRFRRRRRC